MPQVCLRHVATEMRVRDAPADEPAW